ncbi:MAG: ABC transporter ATP-binding protein, partial [candidate division Zixibacteria bacterium]|nr:ABC transporter ATP-binding protein [candidate division Zixibacteria bacterium]
MTCLKVSNLSYSIADKTLLRNISFTVEQGETIAIVGPNGAGKTTLLKLILSIYKAQRGSIALFDKDSTSLSSVERARLTSYVPQREEIAPSFTVSEFVEMSLYSQGMRFSASPESRRKVTDALESVGMNEFSQRLIPTLSGGEWQKIALARALVRNPQVLV